MSDYPYPGLRPFQRDEIDIFFGREPHVDQLIKRLGPTHFLAVVGLSGCGKSSLVRAGLWSDLETGFLASAGSRWQVAEFRPGYRPFANLATALLKTDWGQYYLPQLTDRTEAAAFLQAQVRRVSLGVHGVLQETPLPADTNLLLIVDQFEEIFRYYQQGDADEAEAFVAMLLASSQPSHLSSEEKHRVYVVITMRSDFLGNCALFAGLSEAINEGQFLVPRLTREQLREAIEFPARVFGGEIEATVVNQLLNDAGTDFDQLPLLQHALMRMWKFASTENPEQIIVTLKHYDQIGGLANALSQHADKGYAKLNSDQQKIAEFLFRSLCEYGSDNRDTRRPVKLKEVATLANVPWEQVAAVVEEFRKPWRSFLVPPVDKELSPDSVLDISHESLIRKWQRLRRWTEEEAESAKLYRRLEDSACRWEQKQAALWHSPDLEIAVAWRDQKQPTAQWAKRYGQQFDLAMRFLEESEEARRQGQRKKEEDRQRLLKLKQARKQAIWAVVGMIGAIMLAGWVFLQNRLILQLKTDNLFESQLSQATLLAHDENYAAAKKVLEKSRDLDQDISDASRRHARNLLARFTDIMGGEPQPLEYKVEDTPLHSVAVSPDGHLLAVGGERGKLVLFDLHTDKPLQSLIGHNTQEAVSTIVFHPKGKWLASAARDKSIIFWSMPSGKKQAEWSAPDKVRALAISHDGKYLASGGEDGNIILWEVGEVGTGKQLFTLKGHTKSISNDGLAFDSTGKLLASASAGNTVYLWEVNTGNKKILTGHTDEVNSVEFSPDDEKLATSGADRTVRLWQVDPGDDFGKELMTLNGHRGIVFKATFFGKGRYLISASQDKTLRIWETESGVAVRVLQGHSAQINNVTTHQQEAFSVSTDDTVKRWNISLPGQHIIYLPNPSQKTDHHGPLSVAIAPTGHQVVAVGFAGGALRLYALPDLQLLWQDEQAHLGEIPHLAFNSEGNLLATTSDDKSVKLWQVTNNALQKLESFPLGNTDNEAQPGYAVTFSPQSNLIAVGTKNGAIGLLNWKTKQKIFYPVGNDQMVYSVAFDAIDKILLSSTSDGHLRRWKVAIQSLSLTKFDDDVAKFFDKSQFQLSINFSPDDQWVASGGKDFLIHIWDAKTGQSLYSLPGHDQSIVRVIFSNKDGQQLVTAGADNTIKVWDLNLSQGQELFTLPLPTRKRGGDGRDFDFRCFLEKCWIVVPLVRSNKLIGYELGKIYE